jgi:hypothetical protein
MQKKVILQKGVSLDVRQAFCMFRQLNLKLVRFQKLVLIS